MFRPLTTCLTIAIAASAATAAACNDDGVSHRSTVIIIDDHASWIERDLWQFEPANAERATTDPQHGIGTRSERAMPEAVDGEANPQSVAGIDADAEDRSWLVRDRWQFAAAPDAEYLSWLVRDLWQFEPAPDADRPLRAGP